jgi:hypothetical protein
MQNRIISSILHCLFFLNYCTMGCNLRLFIVSALLFFSFGQQLFALSKLYVGNFPVNTTEEEITQLFASKGVDIKVIDMRYSSETDEPEPLGYCFIVIEDSMLRTALTLDGDAFKNLQLKVRKPTPRCESN